MRTVTVGRTGGGTRGREIGRCQNISVNVAFLSDREGRRWTDKIWSLYLFLFDQVRVFLPSFSSLLLKKRRKISLLCQEDKDKRQVVLLRTVCTTVRVRPQEKVRKFSHMWDKAGSTVGTNVTSNRLFQKDSVACLQGVYDIPTHRTNAKLQFALPFLQISSILSSFLLHSGGCRGEKMSLL